MALVIGSDDGIQTCFLRRAKLLSLQGCQERGSNESS